jgi:hypothetical protein
MDNLLIILIHIINLICVALYLIFLLFNYLFWLSCNKKKIITNFSSKNKYRILYAATTLNHGFFFSKSEGKAYLNWTHTLIFPSLLCINQTRETSVLLSRNKLFQFLRSKINLNSFHTLTATQITTRRVFLVSFYQFSFSPFPNQFTIPLLRVFHCVLWNTIFSCFTELAVKLLNYFYCIK